MLRGGRAQAQKGFAEGSGMNLPITPHICVKPLIREKIGQIWATRPDLPD
jgi:hypothetical protein